MKTKEEIEKEYEGYSLKSDFVTNLDEFYTYIEIGIDDTEESSKELQKEIRENKRQELEAKIRNFFFFIFEQEEIDFYAEDTSIVQEGIALALRYREYFQMAQEIATEENFKELVRLIDFSTEYYNEHVDYFESLRDALELSLKGITFFNGRYNDSRESFDQFYLQKIQELTPKKEVEKTKNI